MSDRSSLACCQQTFSEISPCQAQAELHGFLITIRASERQTFRDNAPLELLVTSVLAGARSYLSAVS